MRNIPTDLLRSFVTIIDLKGYRRAGDQLGRTQPAMSLQMKRLQELLGVTLFARGSSLELSEQGRIVADHARRILAQNDAMLAALNQRQSLGTLKLGIPNDYADHFLPRLMPQLAKKEPQMTFDVVCHLSHLLFKGLEDDQYDLIVALTPKGGSAKAFRHWPEPLAWVGARGHEDHWPASDNRATNSGETAAGAAADGTPVRIVCYPQGCLYRQSMIAALDGAGRAHELVYTSPSLAGLQAAVSTGFGVTVLSRRIVPKELAALDDPAMPALEDAEIGVYIHPKHKNSPVVRALAQSFAALFSEGEAAR